MMKSEIVLTFLSEVFRREAKLPQEVKSLAESMTTLATEITKISNSIIKLTKLINDPEKPFVLVLGGKKTADKLPVIKNLFGKTGVRNVGFQFQKTDWRGLVIKWVKH